ncbi:MAG: response regulator [Planctomycetes bacterium]|nr:response regulator [Planctomycetota bacterium]
MLEAVHVLQIEDSPTVIQLTRSMLADATIVSFAHESVETLSAGIKRIAQGGVDVVLLDLTLPDSQGIDTFNILHAAAAKLPVVIYTSVDDEELSLLALHQGAADYFVKSEVNSKWLTRSLTFALSRSRYSAPGDNAEKADPVTAKRSLTIEKLTTAPGSYTVRINDKKMVSLVTMEAIKNRLLNLVRRADCNDLQIDFSKVEYVANAAISMLLTVNKQANATSKDLVLSNVSPQVYEQFSSRRFDKIFQIERTDIGD